MDAEGMGINTEAGNRASLSGAAGQSGFHGPQEAALVEQDGRPWFGRPNPGLALL